MNTTLRQALEFVLYFVVLISSHPTELSLTIGFGVSLLGLAIRILATGYRYSEDTFMVRGPYRFVRHPHYLGSILLAVGMCLAGRNIFAAIITFLSLAAIYQGMIRAEENRLMIKWGPRYRVFRANVSAIVPQLIPVVPAGGQGVTFSFKNSIIKGRMRELNAAFALMIIFAGLYWSSQVHPALVFYKVVAGTAVAIVVFRIAYYGFSGKSKQSRGAISTLEL